jgi:8-oxo-dGTP pyrophosphatase MutT (NUDIX family)
MEPEDFYVPQAGAIPVRNGLFCLITSRGRRKWIFPKGMIDPGFSPREIAVQEAWEEAGLRGTLSQHPIGSYRYSKWGERFEVSLFLLEVTQVHDDWPERSFRMRRWVSLADALERVENPVIRQILVNTFRLPEEDDGGS